MDTYLEDLFAKREHAWSRQQEILNRAVEEGRDNTPEELEEIAKTDTAIDSLLDQERKHITRIEAIQAGNKFRAEMAPQMESAREQRKDPTDVDMLRKLFSAARDDQPFSFLAGPKNADEMRAYNERGKLPRNAAEYRALQSAGGSAIETSFFDLVTIYERTEVPLLRPDISRVIETTNGAPLVFPRVTADPSLGSTVTAEAAAATEADMTLSAVTLGSFKYNGISIFSEELDADNVIGLEDIVAQELARQLAISGVGAALTTGGGTTAPWGVVSHASNGGTAAGTSGAQASDTFFSVYDLIDLKYGRAEQYRSRGSWMVSNTALVKMRKMRDSTGQLLWSTNLVAGLPPTFDGNPVYENPAMAAVASVSKSVLFGDFSRFFVKRVVPIKIQTSSEYKFSTGQIAIKVTERVDSDLVDTAAVAYLISANT